MTQHEINQQVLELIKSLRGVIGELTVTCEDLNRRLKKLESNGSH